MTKIIMSNFQGGDDNKWNIALLSQRRRNLLASAIALVIIGSPFEAGAANCFVAGDTQILSAALSSACTLSSTVAPYNNISIRFYRLNYCSLLYG